MSGRLLLQSATGLAARHRGFHAAAHGPAGGPPLLATTILAVRKAGEVVVIGDGQVSFGDTVMKPNARKVRRVGPRQDVICGMAGATADCFTLIERLESKLEQHPRQLMRACVEVVQMWRTERSLRHLHASLIVCDARQTFQLTGTGDVIQSHDGCMAIGSGGLYAAAAARALLAEDLMIPPPPPASAHDPTQTSQSPSSSSSVAVSPANASALSPAHVLVTQAPPPMWSYTYIDVEKDAKQANKLSLGSSSNSSSGNSGGVLDGEGDAKSQLRRAKAKKAAAATTTGMPLTAEHVARRAMLIASDMCIYTNHHYVVDRLRLEDAERAEREHAAKLAGK